MNKRVIHLTESRHSMNITEIGEHDRKIDNDKRELLNMTKNISVKF